MHTVFALLCFVVVIHWLIFPYLSGLLHWHCGNITIAQVPAKQPWWIWINTSCEFIMNDCITITEQSTTKPCAYFLEYTVACDAIVQYFRNLWRYYAPMRNIVYKGRSITSHGYFSEAKWRLYTGNSPLCTKIYILTHLHISVTN